MTLYQTDQAFAEQLDADDPLASFRSRFHLPQRADGETMLYFCGHSLGLQPRTTASTVEQVLHQWQTLGIKGYFSGERPWIEYSASIKPLIAEIVGATPLEVTLMNSVTVNLHLMLTSFYQPTPSRYKIIMEAGAFPSDQYAVQSHLRWHGYDPAEAIIELTPPAGETTIPPQAIAHLLAEQGESVAMVLLGGVNYLSGQLFDMESISAMGHEHGCVVGFDLAHAVGNVPLSLHAWGVDFAVWCSYKYLNSGPAAVGGCFVHEQYAHQTDLPRLAGWWGNRLESRFEMRPIFEPALGADGWQISNPNVLSLAAMRASLEIFAEAGMVALHDKSRRLTGYLAFMLESLESDRIRLITPIDPQQRGCQLSLEVQEGGKSLYEQLRAHHVICDWREPNVMRVTPVSLYNQYREVFQFVTLLKQLL